ncbi:MAG: hypothetical protein ACP5LX_07080, partial [Nitrososphaeria archaeon]
QPVLDVCALDKDYIMSLAAVFDKYASADFGRIPDQYRTFNEDRFNFDIEILRTLNPGLSQNDAEVYLKNLYTRLSNSLAAY